ncbi:hypothetical protein NS183_05735 [Microbacterium testaceum]|uniref:hypothetical protein n=1 Tax=Microbacterium testaceum TaxID=2033 RepID=UPI000734F4B1|nr:hypothetical protein [Microbacterium testaceum]KTS91149.1 hypothetical protein NS183_05735 [Microbacterium testaceum]
MAQDPVRVSDDLRFRNWPRAYQVFDRHASVFQAVEAFHSFFLEEFADTDFAREAVNHGISEPVTELRCLLDFVFVWLIEGRASFACPSFEEYLMAIIGITDEARYDERDGTYLYLRTATSTTDGVDITYWGERPESGGPLFRYMDGWSSRESDRGYYAEGLPTGWQGWNHPAISRDTYESARSADLRRLSKAT